jgi:predicted nucleic acid-binding Zn ribbon protein
MAGRRNDMSLGEAIEHYLQSNGLKEKVLLENVIQDWPRIMGKAIAENTDQLWFRSGIFYVRMKNPIWRTELGLAKSKIKDMLNKELGASLVTEVKVV